MMQEAGCRRQEAGGLFFSLSVSVKTNLLPTLPLHKMMMIRGGTTVATVALFLLMKAPHQELKAPYYC